MLPMQKHQRREATEGRKAVIRSRTIASHAAPENFAPGVCRALGALGYDIVSAAEDPPSPELQIVNEESLEQIGRGASLPAPIVVLTRDPIRRPRDSRVVDALQRPVSFRDLYASLQRLFEPTPRADPRVTTMRPARCTYANATLFGDVISLSEGGCLFRSHREPPNESDAKVLFALPPNHRIEVRAHTVRRAENLLGLRFLDASPDIRSTIGSYVIDELLAM